MNRETSASSARERYERDAEWHLESSKQMTLAGVEPVRETIDRRPGNGEVVLELRSWSTGYKSPHDLGQCDYRKKHEVAVTQVINLETGSHERRTEFTCTIAPPMMQQHILGAP